MLGNLVLEPTAGTFGVVHSAEISDAASRAQFDLGNGIDPVIVLEKYGDDLKIIARGKTWRQPAAQAVLTFAGVRINQLVAEIRDDLAAYLDGNHDPDREVLKPVELYRLYGAWLQRIIALDLRVSDVARELLSDIYLEQTQPQNALASPAWVDGYTGEIDLPPLFVGDAGLVYAREYVEEEKPEETDWALYLERRMTEEYGEEIAPLAIQASMEYVGANVEEDEIHFDELSEADDDELPVYMTDEFPVSEEAWATRARIAAKLKTISEWAADMRTQHPGWRRWIEKKQQEKVEDVHAEFMRTARRLRPWERAFIAELGDWDPDEYTVVVQGIIPKDSTFASADHLVYERVERRSLHSDLEERIVGGELHDREVGSELTETFADDNKLIGEMVAGLHATPREVMADPAFQTVAAQYRTFNNGRELNPIRFTKSWNEAYMRAIAGGANLKTAEDTAWDAWRQSASTAGAAAYRRAAEKKWGAFYNAARAAGDIPYIPVAVNRDGIVVEPSIGGQPRRISWNLAKFLKGKGELVYDEERMEQAIQRMSQSTI